MDHQTIISELSLDDILHIVNIDEDHGDNLFDYVEGLYEEEEHFLLV